jgi:hypothetical protein
MVDRPSTRRRAARRADQSARCSLRRSRTTLARFGRSNRRQLEEHARMSQMETGLENEPPRGHARIVYLGPVAPHWELQFDFGDRASLEAFRDRVMARLVLVPPHDPQFRRNRERVVRDAEREHLLLEWDLGIPEDAPAEA